jgi:PadR family transcriptional regulator PadR
MTKRDIDLLQGTLDMLILKALQLEPLHGYAVAKRIQQLSADVLRVEEGSLYPALHRMEQRGWIAAEWGASENNRKAKFYSLTRKGRQQLESETADWTELSAAIARVMESGG